MFAHENVGDYFSDALEKLECDKITKAYIVSIFAKFKSATEDYSKESLTLLYSTARSRNDFFIFQGLGDWIFWLQTYYPEYLTGASTDYYSSLGQLSYYQCFKLLNKQWIVYQTLADEFIPLSTSARQIIRGQQILP